MNPKSENAQNADIFLNNYCDNKCFNNMLTGIYNTHHTQEILLNPNIKNAKNAEKLLLNINKFFCEYCNFNCNKKSNYAKHLTTDKHNHNLTNNTIINNNQTKEFICECKKSYKHST